MGSIECEVMESGFLGSVWGRGGKRWSRNVDLMYIGQCIIVIVEE